MRPIDADTLKFRACTEYDCKDKPCEDCLDQYVTKREIDNAPTVDTYTEDDIKEVIKAGYEAGYEMAKVKFERPQGKWIDYSENEGYVECPICNHLTNCDGNIEELHYCWNCGAEMRGKDELNELGGENEIYSDI